MLAAMGDILSLMTRRFIDRLSAMPSEKRLYFLRWQPSHLASDCGSEALQKILSHFDFVQAKVGFLEPEELIQDYDLSDDPGLKLIQSALQLSAHVLREDPVQLASQLFARLVGLTLPAVQELLGAARHTDLAPWLCPLRASLTGPGQPLLRTLRGHSYQVNAVAMTSDGRQVVSGSSDHTLRL